MFETISNNYCLGDTSSKTSLFGMTCHNCHGGEDYGAIHGTSSTGISGSNSKAYNRYRFISAV